MHTFYAAFSQACARYSELEAPPRRGTVDLTALDVAGEVLESWKGRMSADDAMQAAVRFNEAHNVRPLPTGVGRIYRGNDNAWELVLTTRGLLCFVPGRPPAVPAVELTEPRKQIKQKVDAALDFEPGAIIPMDPVKLMDQLSTIFHSTLHSRFEMIKRIINSWNITCGGPGAPEVDITAVSNNEWILAYHQGRFQLTERPKGDPK